MTNNIIMTKVEIDHFHKIKSLIGHFLICDCYDSKTTKRAISLHTTLKPVLPMNLSHGRQSWQH